jgi:hypothetical protein
VRTQCRHDDAAWTPTAVPGIEVQEVAHDGARLVVLRQQIAERPQAGGKQLREVPGCYEAGEVKREVVDD